MPMLPLSPDMFKPMFRLHQTISDTPGDDGPLTSFGLFLPHPTDYGIWFLDAQVTDLEGDRNPGEQTLNWASNVGLGIRWLDASDDVLGLSFWWDMDHSRPQFTEQASVAFEMLGPVWKARSNLYVPIGYERVTEGFTGLGAPFYFGENILFPRTEFDQVSMLGLDAEIGRPLPGWLGENGVSLYGGAYFYRTDKTLNATGVSARLEAIVSPVFTLDAKVTSDPIFKNEASFGITWILPCGRCKSCGPICNEEYYRLTEPVERNRTIVFGTQAVNSPAVATSPTTGQPIIVVHVDSNAATPGNGTFAMPYKTLAAAQAGSAPNDIILVDAGSMFSGQSITLQNSQRFLGEGVPHTVDTVQSGTITLPPPTGGTALPIIANSPGDAVTLANSNEVSGFIINNSGGAAIAGNGISGTANINNNQINGGATGINIQNSSANVTVASTPIAGAATGINLANNTGTFNASGPQSVTGSTATGVALSGLSGATTFDNLTVNATSGTGLSATNLTAPLTITTGTVTAAAGTGVSVNNAPLAVSLTSVNSTGGTNGISLNQASGSFAVTGTGSTAGSGGTIANSTGDGIAVTNSTGTVAISNVNVNNAGGNGATVSGNAAGSSVTLNNLTVSNPAGVAVSVTGNAGTVALNSPTTTGGTIGLDIENNTGAVSVAGRDREHHSDRH